MTTINDFAATDAWTEPTNAERARWAELALYLHGKLTGGEENEYEVQLTDLLTDLIHWADTKQIVFEDIVIRAQDHYAHEIGDYDDD